MRVWLGGKLSSVEGLEGGLHVVLRIDPSLGTFCTGKRCLRGASCPSRQWVIPGLEGTWVWGSHRAS